MILGNESKKNNETYIALEKDIGTEKEKNVKLTVEENNFSLDINHCMNYNENKNTEFQHENILGIRNDPNILNINKFTEYSDKDYNEDKETTNLIKKSKEKNLNSTLDKFKNKDHHNINLNFNENDNCSFDKSKYETKISTISIDLEQNPSVFSLFQGLICMAISCIFKSIFSVLSKYAMNNIKNLSSYQLLTFRTYMMLIISFLVISFSKIKIFSEDFIKSDKLFLLFIRTILGITSMSLLVFCFKNLYISDVYSIYYVYPAFLIVFSMIFFKEKISCFDVICLFACITGAILVVKPNFIFNKTNSLNLFEEKKTTYLINSTINDTILDNLKNETKLLRGNNITTNKILFLKENNYNSNYNTKNDFNEDRFHKKGFFVFLVILAALIKATEDFVMKDIVKQVHFLAFPFIYTIIGIIIFPIPMIAFDSELAKITIIDILLIFCIGCCSFIYICLLALAFQNENAGRVSMINYFQIIFMYLSDLLIFDKQLDLSDLIGTFIIFGFNFLNGLLKTLKRKKFMDNQIIKNNYKNDL